MSIFKNLFGQNSPKTAKPQSEPGQTFILEPILTPSGFVDVDGGDETPVTDVEVNMGGDSTETESVETQEVDATPDTDSEEVSNADETDDTEESNLPEATDSETELEIEEELPFFDSLPEPKGTEEGGESPGVESNETIEPDGELISALSANSSEPEEAETPDTDGIEENPEDRVDETEEDRDETTPVLDISQPNFTFDSGIFTVEETGEVEIDYIFDGGGYQGELAIFSLEGMDEFEPGSEDFIQEASSRALSSSEQGHVVISDADEGARFSGKLGERDQNAGEYLGVKSFNMRSGDTFGVMLVPNKTVAKVFDNPGISGSGRPLFSMVTSNPYEGFHVGQIADVTGDGSTFVMEDIRMDGKTDSDYNDIIFQIRGAKGKAALMDEVLAEGEDWRETELGQGIIEYVKPYVTPDAVDEVAGDLVEDVETLLEFLEDTTEPEESVGEENLGEEPVTTDVVEPEVVEQETEEKPVEEEVTVDEGEGSEPENTVEPTVEQQESDATEEKPVEEEVTVDEGEGSEPENTVEPVVVEQETEATEDNSDEEEPPVAVEENNPVAEDEASTQVAETEENQPVEEEEAVVAETTETENQESSDVVEENAVEEQESVEAVEGENTETAWVEPEPTVKQELVERLETLAVNLEEIDTEESSITELKATVTTLTETLAENSEDFSEVQEVATTRLVNRLEALAQQWVSRGEEPVALEFAETEQPLVGVIDTGFSGDNPDIDYSRITLGTDYVEGDDNPLLSEGEGNEHGTHILGIIGATEDNEIGIDGVNDTAPLWVSRAIGSGQWAESLVEFVDAARESGQPNAVVNLSMDLTQIDAEGNLTTRYELTPDEREAIEYARQHNVLIVAAAGNDGSVMSALGQASQEFDNIMTVGAAEPFDPDTSVWKGTNRTDYSSYGQGLDVMAYGGTMENPQLSLAGEGTSAMAGTSVATAKVTGAVSQVWAANPELNYRQVVEIIRDTATDLGTTGDDAETGAGLLNLLAAVQVAKEMKPEEHSTPALLSPDSWSGEGVFTPGERAVQNVVVPPEWRRQYHGWLDSSNPSDTFAFRIDEETSLQYSIDFPGNAVLRKNGRVILKGKYDGNITYAGANGKLSPGSYTLTVDRHGLPVESYKLIMNFIDGSHGQQMPVIEWLPAKPVVQPQPTPTPTPTPTPSPSPEEVAAKKRAADKVRAVYEANRGRLGNSRREIQIFEQAFNGVNMPAVQYFDGGYIIWNGQKAIPYFTGTGNALPNIDLPSTVKPIWDVVKPSNVVKVPDGRHTYPNMRGSSEYWVELDGDKNDISLAARDTSLAHPDLRTTVYRDLGGGQLQQVPWTDINPDDNYTNYKDLPDGKYLIKVDVEQNKANVPYEMVVNLDQAGDTGIKAWNINRESVSGQLAGQRIVRSDHVGLPSGDRDLYVFTTDDMATQLRFAVRSQDSDGSEADRQRLLDGDVRVRILDEGGRQIGKPVDSKSREPLFGAQWLEPNSKYYAEVTALNGTKTNYDVVLNFDRLKADGRYEFTNLQGEFDYEFTVDGTNRDLKTAVRSKNGQDMSNIYRPVLYRKVNGTEQIVTPTSTANGISHYETLPKGYYRMVADPILAVHPHLLNQKYTFVHNLDQAGQHRSDARDLGNIGGKRVTKNDFVGKDRTDEVDYYKFSTGSDPYLLQFAVRHGSGNDNLRLEGDVEFALYDKNGKELKKVNSANLKSIYGTYELKPNSEYYVRVKDKSGDGDGGNYHLVLNAEVKRTVKPDPKNETPLHSNPTPSNPLRGFRDPLQGAGWISRKTHPSERSRYAWDFSANRGTPIYAMRSGIVKSVRSTTPELRLGVNGTIDNSNYVLIEHDNGYRSLYLHVRQGSVRVQPGQRVDAGDLISEVGHNGVSTGPHLHVEINRPYFPGSTNHYGPTVPFVIDGR